MSCIVTLRGAMQPLRVEGDFMDVKHQLDLAVAGGSSFIVSKNQSDGSNVMFALENVLTISED